MEADSEDAKPYVSGRNVARFEVNWQGKYVLYRPDEMYSGRFPELFESPKLLVRAVLSDKTLMSVVDRDSHYADQTLVCCARPEDVSDEADVRDAEASEYDLDFVAAQVNSFLESFYFRSALSSDSLGGGAIHCTPGMTGRLPIREIAFETPEEEREAAVEEATNAYEAALEDEENLSGFGNLVCLIHAQEHEDRAVARKNRGPLRRPSVSRSAAPPFARR
jgi:hypothetical protein